MGCGHGGTAFLGANCTRTDQLHGMEFNRPANDGFGGDRVLEEVIGYVLSRNRNNLLLTAFWIGNNRHFSWII